MAYKDPQSSTCCDENKNGVDDNGIEEEEEDGKVEDPTNPDEYGSNPEDPDGANDDDEGNGNGSEGGGDDYDPVIYLPECI